MPGVTPAWLSLLCLTRAPEHRSPLASRSDSGPRPWMRMDADRACAGRGRREAAVDERGHQIGHGGGVDDAAVHGQRPQFGGGHTGLHRAQQVGQRRRRQPVGRLDEHGAPRIPPDLDDTVGPDQHRHDRIQCVARHATTVPRDASARFELSTGPGKLGMNYFGSSPGPSLKSFSRSAIA